MKTPLCLAGLSRLALPLVLTLPANLFAAGSAIVSWNNLGMHCMDSDFSVFSILPPYNTIHAQLIVGGKLVTNMTGYTVTYEAVADPDGSFNSTSLGKGNFYQFAEPLYGAALAVDAGLAGFSMPGPANTPQPFTFDVPWKWFRAEGIPITPYDNAGRKNPYPLMRIVARDSAHRPIATNDIVLPVSDEMDCRACHASGTDPNAQPGAGWVWDSNPERDYRLNILRLHDEMRNPSTYQEVLAAKGFNPAGLYQGVVADGQPVLCASCHLSEALPGTGLPGVPALTAAVHSRHAQVTDPDLHLTLDDSNHRAACYRCHPGSTTRCLRGAMGSAIASDGSMLMQCQSCHGSMSQVGSTSRIGWLQEPNCQSCHSGTATSNNGQIRYTSVFEANGAVRQAVNQTFATTPNTPAPGLSLFRFSTGHGGLQCQACHGSTHAEFPSTHRNDNLRNLRMQGHVGVLSECTACHTTTPRTVRGGPHGLHPVGQAWISQHEDAAESGGLAQCAACHGADYRGTVLSRSQADRTLSTEFGTKVFWRGYQIGCYTCHQGPHSESANPNRPAEVSSVSTNTPVNQAVAITLPVTHTHGAVLTLRIVSQPAHGTVALNNGVATYLPEVDFQGMDAFTFAAWDGSADSNLGTVKVGVGRGPLDELNPTVTITYPTSGARVPQGAVTITGTARDNMQVTQVVYQVNNSGWRPATGTTTWQASPALSQRTNQLQVCGVDSSGNRSRTNTVTFIYVMTDRLTVQTSGVGTLSPNLDGQILEVGRGYQMTAKPHPTNLLAGWSSGASTLSTQATLNFLMQSNLVLVANFVPNPFVPLQGSYRGLFYPGTLHTNTPLEAAVTNSGFFSLTLTAKGQARGKLLLAGRAYSLGRLQFNSELKAQGQVSRSAPLDPIQFSLTLDPSNGGMLSGQVFATDWQSSLHAYALRPNTNFTARHTFLLFGDALDYTHAPPGDGAGVITVDRRGGVRLAGRLAEGTIISRASALSRDGRCPLYVPLQGRRGMLLGWLQFGSDHPPFDVLGDPLVWIRPPATTAAEKHYPNGFSVVRELAGAKYQAPAPGQNVLAWTDGVLEFGGGNLGMVLSNQVRWANNRLTVLDNTRQVNMTVALSSGLCNGTFLHPQTGSLVRFRGALLQGPGWGGGWFQGSSQGGYFWLGPPP